MKQSFFTHVPFNKPQFNRHQQSHHMHIHIQTIKANHNLAADQKSTRIFVEILFESEKIGCIYEHKGTLLCHTTWYTALGWVNTIDDATAQHTAACYFSSSIE